MSAPAIVSTPQYQWTRVAEAVTSGVIDRLKTGMDYWQTYRSTGLAAPNNPVGTEIPSEAVRMFPHMPQDIIDAGVPIDVYVLCVARDGKTRDPGQVRVSV